MSDRKRMIIGISGASGVIYGIEILKILKELNIETHLVITKAGEITRAHETTLTRQEFRKLADFSYHIDDLAAPISSGSFKTMGMIIAPCSMRTVGEIAYSITSNLLTRAADVVLKERRRLVALVRETPLNASHLKSMLALTEMGGIIAPPVPAFYTHPQSLQEMVAQTVGRALDLFDIETKNFPRWGEDVSLTNKNTKQNLVNELEESVLVDKA